MGGIVNKVDTEIGNRYGSLVVIAQEGMARNNCRNWRCLCDCGQETLLATNALRRPNGTRSCGCGRVITKHGHTRKGGHTTSEYQAWLDAKHRCTNSNNRRYADYGGRGIHVCDEWLHDFAAFYAHVGPRPDSSLSLDRIDNDGNYEPGNVRWATATEQARNRRTKVSS